ncbi:MAG: DUF5680 domain-containing protein [Candidatus Bathyarchaeota archaeon]|nr:DUF5680 domain-containing protein [Candidatus Bathyarchaeota archaeon]
MDLTDFLVEAKRRTYGSGAEPMKLDDGSKEYRVEIDEHLYRDRYFGGNPFIGQEVVYRNRKPVWSMNYYGKATGRTPEEVFSFLGKALGLVESKKPYRGPEKYVEGPWSYTFFSRGNINSFWGEEEIQYDGIRVHWLKFHGGEIDT